MRSFEEIHAEGIEVIAELLKEPPDMLEDNHEIRGMCAETGGDITLLMDDDEESEEDVTGRQDERDPQGMLMRLVRSK